MFRNLIFACLFSVRAPVAPAQAIAGIHVGDSASVLKKLDLKPVAREKRGSSIKAANLRFLPISSGLGSGILFLNSSMSSVTATLPAVAVLCSLPGARDLSATTIGLFIQAAGWLIYPAVQKHDFALWEQAHPRVDPARGASALGLGFLGMCALFALAMCLRLGEGKQDDKTAEVVPVSSRQLLQTLSGHTEVIESLAWSPDGKVLASAHLFTVKPWERSSGRLIRTVQEDPQHWVQVGSPVGWSPNGKILATGGGGSGKVSLWNAESGELLRTLNGHSEQVNAVAWSPDGKTVASGGFDCNVKLWDVQTGQLLRTLKGQAGAVSSVAWIPDGQWLASGHENTTEDNCGRPADEYDEKTVKLWDVHSGRLFRAASIKDAGSNVRALRWSPDGKTLAIGTAYALYLRDARTWRLLLTVPWEQTSQSASLAWSPDGSTIASGNEKTVRLQDSHSGELRATFTGHLQNVTAVAWSPDGKMLASGADDHTVKLWDVSTIPR